jgi:hypothetical protein
MSSLDLNVVVAGATVVAALAAVGAALAAIWQARFTTRVQVLLQFTNSWSSDAMLKTRISAAAALLNDKPSVDVDNVLDFFETIAGLFVKPRGLFRLRVIPDEWARHTFYWCAACYWSKSRDYISTVRQRPTERDAWKDLCDLMPRWVKAEGGEPPTSQDIDDFLRDERRGLRAGEMLSQILG